MLLAAATAFPACSQNGPSKGNSRIIVVGAGIAGIAAASDLKARGFDVTVIEARNRIGGRIYTDRSLGMPVDLGAQWIEGTTSNPVAEIAGRIGAPLHETDEDNTFIYTTKALSEDEAEEVAEEVKRLEQQAEKVAEDSDEDISVAQAVYEALGSRRRSPEIEWVLKTIELGISDSLDVASAWYSDDDEGVDGPGVVLPLGYDQIAHELAKGLDIRLGEPVREINYSRSEVSAVTLTGEYRADRVIVTVPLGVLKAGDLNMHPALSDKKARAIERLGFGAVTKVAMKFPRAFWPDSIDFLGFAPPGGSKFAVTMNLSRFQSSPALLAYAAGNDARSLGTSPTSAIANEVMDALRAMFGNSVADPEAVTIWQWASDPFAKGAYSFVTVGNSSSDYDVIAQPVENRVFFAGEATNRDFRATVHGALLSGRREAQRIASL